MGLDLSLDHENQMILVRDNQYPQRGNARPKPIPDNPLERRALLWKFKIGPRKSAPRSGRTLPDLLAAGLCPDLPAWLLGSGRARSNSGLLRHAP